MSEIIIYEEECKECTEKNEEIIEPVDISTRKIINSKLLNKIIANYTIQDNLKKENLCHYARTAAETEVSKTNGAILSRFRFN